VLRSSLSLAILTGRRLRMRRVRAGRRKPGLRRQHLTAARAAAAICGATLDGDRLDNTCLEFSPGPVRAGSYIFDVGSAGSACLVLQTLLPPLLAADGPSRLELLGGTHNPWAPPADFLQQSFLPLLERMGASVKLELRRHGFYPRGGGQLAVTIQPADGLRPLELLGRGPARGQRARALVADLPRTIGQRELRVVEQELGWRGDQLAVEELPAGGGPGNALVLELRFEQLTELVTAFGQRGLRAELVAASAVRQARAYLASSAPVGLYLADQLLLPLAMAGGGAFRAAELSSHASTNIATIRRFLELDLQTERQLDNSVLVQVG
jgi:RNA 3'-terminal phosphate cyclase (ATP)